MTAPTKRTRAAAKAAAPVAKAAEAAPVKRARPSRLVAPAAVAEEAEIPEAEDDLEPGWIRFKGRKMQVVKLSADQWAMWVLTAEQLQKAFDTMSPTDAGRLVKLLRRAYHLILLVLTEPDKEWLQEEILEGAVEITEATGVLDKALKAYEAMGTGKPAAPTTGPRPKARRGR